MVLPVNIEATYGTAADLPPVEQHQQHHDEIHAVVNTQIVGPRNLPRVKSGIQPALLVDAVYPATNLGTWSHRLLSTEGATWWAFGHDGSLRKSTTEGNTWFRTYKAATDGQMGRDGMWLTTTAGSLLTTWHPFSGAAPWIMRATSAGTTWTTVVPQTTDVKYLGPTSICQSPVTGYLYLAEYVTTDTVATINIKRSIDDGVTWTVWKSMPRNTSAASTNTTGITHFHGIQVDPIDNRLWVCVGDAPPSAGLYRLTADETDWAAVATNSQLNTAGDIWGGAVSLMFFPDYIAWGVDQSFTGGVVRMARTQIGQAAPVVEKVAETNSTGFYACRTSTANTEWVLSASQEGQTQRIDPAVHLYRVADNGATVDEIASIPVNTDGPAFSWAYPMGTPLQTRTDKLMWWGTNIYDGQGNAADLSQTGMQFSCRVGWSHDVFVRPAPTRKYEIPATYSTGYLSGIVAGATVNFGATVVPARVRRLYIIDLGVKDWGGQTAPSVEVTDSAGVVINSDAASPLAFATIGLRAAGQDDTAPYLSRTAQLTAGSEVRFRVKNNAGSLTINMSGFVTFAWGY